MAVVAVHKVKQGVAADGGRYWRCGDPQHISRMRFIMELLLYFPQKINILLQLHYKHKA